MSGIELTRESLRSGAVHAWLRENVPELPLMDDWERHASLRAHLALRPDSGDVWVFGYGSLIWNPAFDFVERRRARIPGFHRRFCLQTITGRGSRECPGLMLGLESGGSCTGVAYRIDARAALEELDIVWRREMLTEAYRPVWSNAFTAAGRVWAIAFAMNHRDERYAGRLSEEAVAARLAKARGPLGTCREYLEATVEHLTALGFDDVALARIRKRVRQLPEAP